MLYKEFVDNSVWLYYKELYGILLNLIQVDKGVDVFLNIINSSERDTYTNKDWTFYAKYAKKKKYIPQQCANFCPYHEKCQHEINMLETAVIQRRDIVVLKEPEFVDITSAQSDLYNAFNKAMAADDKKIHIIKAQTSIGKTHMYIDYLKNADAPCMIAVPTNILKHQVHRECIKAGIDAIKTPSIQEIRDELPQDIYDKIQTLYATGNHKRANIYLKEKAKEIPVLKNYLEEKENVMNYHGHIITTHHRVLYSNESWLKKYKIIIDEDILMTIVCNQEKIDLADVEEFSEKNRIPKTIRKYLNKLLSLSEEYELFSVEPIEDHLDECSFNINDLMKGKYFYSDGEYIYFYRRNGLSDTKYVVLSATASEYVYEHFFGKDTIIFHECPTAKYKGQLIQHYGGSYSRAYIKKNMGIFDNIKNKYGNIDTITFKKYSSSDSELHIGNTEGINSLEGKDIAVIGTPHQPPFIYSLLALHMDCADTEQPHYRDIVHNGYHFWFYTYKNEILRNIQLWMIESELEQCVGRARLLRNDCTVHLFSDYPIRHAKLTRD